MSVRSRHVKQWLEEHKEIGDYEHRDELEHYEEVLHKDRDACSRKSLTELRHDIEEHLEKKKFADEFDYLDDIDENAD